MSNAQLEILVSGEITGQMCNLSIYDPTTGTNLRIYKGNSTKPKTLCFLGNSFVVSGQPNKPLLNVWHLNKHEQKPVKYITPGVMQTLASSPCGHILVGTIDERIYIWQTASGKLLNIITNGHYQKINATKFTSDGCHFVTAGDDGNVLLWVVDSSKPRQIWSHHSLAVTDLYVGIGAMNCRVYSVSKDQTMKVYQASTGQLLLDVEFNDPLNALALDASEECAFAGTTSGPIYMVSLTSPPRDLKMSVPAKDENIFKGHTQAVTCLSVSMDGLTLASGSLDTDVRLWHIKSKQCIKVIPHKGALTTLMYMMPKRGMLRAEDYKADVNLCLLEKTIVDKKIIESDLYTVDIVTNDIDNESSDEEPSARSLISFQSQSQNSNPKETSQEPEFIDTNEIKRLKVINQKLYEAAAKAILKE